MNEPSARHVPPDLTGRPGAGPRTPDPYAKLLDERIVFLGTPIDDTSANDVTAQFVHLEHRAPDRDISLYINSPGGSFTAMTAIYDTMRQVSCDVETVCLGQAASTAAVLQSALAMLAPVWGLKPLLDIDERQARDDLARAAVMALSYVAQSARGQGLPMVPQSEIDKAQSVVERFMIRWRGEPDPKHVAAVDAYWTSAAEHGMNASTFTARVIASTGADVAAALSGAVGAMSGPLHGGAPSRVLGMIEEIERTGDAEAFVKRALDKGERLMGFGHRVYRAEDPRARVLRRTARELGAPRFEIAEALEKAALAELHARRPDRVLATNVEFWAAIVLDFAEVPAHMFTSMFTCARTAGWSAHILEQKRTGRLVRPSARYVGPGSRGPQEIAGYGDIAS
ncbi:citrate synthase [Streptomyces sp. NPDC005568]|uniref:citrate synthase n=1 Tax=Streptomyces sp. NPDC005568 TaxID=3156887 RepID=UPI0033B0C877